MKSLQTALTPLALALGLTVAATAHADYTGPTANATVQTVEAALAAKKDDTPVRLTGVVVRQIKGDRYLFRDSTGEIEIDLDDGLALPTFDDKTPVEITGELDRNRLSANEIDVKQLRVLTP